MEKTLKTLIRLTDHLLDAQRRELANLIAKESYIQECISKNNAEKEQELAQIKDIKTGYSFMTAYVVRMDQQKKLYQDQLKTLQKQMDRQKNLVTETYAELKRYEITKDKIIAEQAAEALRLEQIELDEVAIQKYQRLKATADA